MSNPTVVPGSYAKLNQEDKAIVDSILVTNTIQAAAAAEAMGQKATDAELTAKFMLDAILAKKTTTDLNAITRIGEAGLETGRELFANQPELIATIRKVHQEQKSTPADLENFTRIVNDMINLDGDQFDIQKDLPNLSGTPRQR